MSENSTLVWIGAVLAVVIGGIVWFLRGRSGGRENVASTKPAIPPSESPALDSSAPPAPPMQSSAELVHTPVESGASVVQPSHAHAVDMMAEVESKTPASVGRKKAPTRKKTATPKKTGKAGPVKKPRPTKKK